MKSVIEDVRCKAIEIWKQEGIMQGKVTVTAKTLSTEEAIGDPEGDDFPLQTGKERAYGGRVHGIAWSSIY